MSTPDKALPLSHTHACKIHFFLEKMILRWVLYMAENVLWFKRPCYIKPLILQSHNQAAGFYEACESQTGNTSIHGFYYRPCHTADPKKEQGIRRWPYMNMRNDKRSKPFKLACRCPRSCSNKRTLPCSTQTLAIANTKRECL